MFFCFNMILSVIEKRECRCVLDIVISRYMLRLIIVNIATTKTWGKGVDALRGLTGWFYVETWDIMKSFPSGWLFFIIPEGSRIRRDGCGCWCRTSDLDMILLILLAFCSHLAKVSATAGRYRVERPAPTGFLSCSGHWASTNGGWSQQKKSCFMFQVVVSLWQLFVRIMKHIYYISACLKSSAWSRSRLPRDLFGLDAGGSRCLPWNFCHVRSKIPNWVPTHPFKMRSCVWNSWVIFQFSMFDLWMATMS